MNNLEIENARLIFKNFSGAPTEFNKQGGVRTVTVIIDDPEMAEALINDGWNLRPRQSENKDTEPAWYLGVEFRFDILPPVVYSVTSRKKKLLNEKTINILDYCDIISADIIIRPRHYEVGGKTGIKAYAKELYAVIEESRFANKYADIPEDGEENTEEMAEI